MKDPGRALRQAYISALAGIIHEGKEVEGYDELAPADAGPYYFIIKNMQEVDHSSKNNFANEVHITLDIVTEVGLESTDGTHRDAIADMIMQRIVKRHQHIEIDPDFKIITTKKTLAKNLTSQTKNIRQYRKIITFKHVIVER